MIQVSFLYSRGEFKYFTKSVTDRAEISIDFMVYKSNVVDG